MRLPSGGHVTLQMSYHKLTFLYREYRTSTIKKGNGVGIYGCLYQLCRTPTSCSPFQCLEVLYSMYTGMQGYGGCLRRITSQL